MSNNYKEGLHILATLKEVAIDKLHTYASFALLIQQLIAAHDLKDLGSVFHNFEGGGFTAVVCLSESHISIHTWPEYALLNMDIYLSNFSRVNDGAVAQIFEALQHYFGGTVHNLVKVKR
ncbi:MAG: S-adenosylmethionine decarboxylase [Taibaiella sp.]|nr:S-adenosylmethionine decarboxylase [Taibaiella sp.]